MAPVIGRRLRRGAVTTAVAAAAVAALAASGAPGAVGIPRDERAAGAADTPPPSGDSATGNSPYYTDLPPLQSPVPPTGAPPNGGDKEAEAGLPATVLDAYKKAESELAGAKPGCHLPWQLLAAIGKVESGQARGGRVDANGTTLTPILGPVLNGDGFAKITDTDNGAYDGDTTHDRAVGPMQFIPSTWATSGRDGNNDGKKDPNNIYDAALAAGYYLCANDRDLAVETDLHQAILSYNRSTEYLNTVLSWLEYYRKGTHEVPDGKGVLPDDRSSDTRFPSTGTSPNSKHPGSSSQKPNPGNKNPGGKNPGDKNPGKGDGGSTKPKPPGDGGTEKPGPSPSDRVDALANAGTGDLVAKTGDAFTERVAVRAEAKSGAFVAKAKVKFTVVGDTDARFEGGAKSATVTTGITGKATAPVLEAGQKSGDFVVRATVVGRSLPGVDFEAQVVARQADALARTSDKELTCEAGKEFADQVEVKATYKGKAADGVATTATLVKSATDATVNDKGPYFKGADGKPVRTLKGLKTDANGVLKLPKLYADDAAGTYLLRITTPGGGALTVELKVSAAEPDATPSPSASSSASPSPSASPSTSTSASGSPSQSS
ncbi:lytic transglycosylase domain-containing protein [Streptomyces kanamyceticus]|uniref:Lytic transglycosylase n=1 Tax=Streptomyces kanamyceticus TaxID=1967 RepID=A0A5J6GM49_STRKN|nr:lytic transglycosylase domain-containing protein [Streptomyces kanamyceticus]QEU95045.1 lytic transglycosylase [Streptomyces kanamyceticus]